MDAQFGGVDQRKIFTFAEKVCLLTSVLSILIVLIIYSKEMFVDWVRVIQK